jgi:tetratricopeptide (TPR) repeat protein
MFATLSRNSLWKDDIILWSDIMNKSPLKLRPILSLASSYQKAGDYKTAEIFYLKALSRFSENPHIYNNLGNVYQSSGRLDEAIDFYKRGLRYKETFQLYFNLALAYEKKGDSTSALFCYKQALRLNPYNSETYNNIGNIYLISNMVDEAMDIYKKGLEFGESFELNFNLGLAYERKGDLISAIRHYREALKLNPGDEETKERLSKLLDRL